MEAIMNKKAILFSLLMGLSPVLHVTASAETMYKDIKGIVEDALTGKDDQQRLMNAREALGKIRWYKQSIQDDIIRLHTKNNASDVLGAGYFATSGILFGALTSYFYS